MCPREAFIDLTRFANYATSSCTWTSHRSDTRSYLEAAEAFLGSPAFEPFTAECFARQLVGMLTEIP